jgi:hypothetical protein
LHICKFLCALAVLRGSIAVSGSQFGGLSFETRGISPPCRVQVSARPGTALKNLRSRNSWTLAEVARLTGTPAPTLSRIEKRSDLPDYDMLLR